MTKQGKFTKSYAHELLRIAKQDLDSAQFLSKQKSLRVENVFLLAQQALEKSLKAVLCWHEMVRFSGKIKIPLHPSTSKNILNKA